MPAKKRFSRKRIERCRFEYEETLTPIHTICARMGFSRSAFYARVSAWKWKRRRYSTAVVADRPLDSPAAPEPAPMRPPEPPAELAPVTPEVLAILHARAVRAFSWELDVIEGVLTSLRPGQQEAQAERTSRVIATVNKTVLEITTFTKPHEAKPTDEPDNDPVPRDIDEFRHELARRIRSFIESRRHGADRLSAEPESSLD